MMLIDDDERNSILELRQHYRVVFSSPSGKLVLTNIMMRCGFFNDDLSHGEPQLIGRHNFIMETLEILGTADNPQRTAEAIVEAILLQPSVEVID